MKNYNAIDLVKLVMAILVVAIHSDLVNCFVTDVTKSIYTHIVGLAVPFFFLVSGFFLYKKIVCSERTERIIRVRKWLRKVLRLYLVWTVIYLPYTIYGFKIQGLGFADSIYHFVKNVIFVGENYYSWPLWYLLAMIVSGILLYSMEKLRFKYGEMLFVSILFTICGMLLKSAHDANSTNIFVTSYYYIFENTRNGFFVGLIYMTIGIGVAKYNYLKTRKMITLTLLILSWLAYYNGIPFGAHLTGFFLFVLLLSVNIKGNVSTFKQFRLMSTIIYFVHMIWVGILVIVGAKEWNPLIFFLAAVLMSALTSIIMLKYQESKWFKLICA